MKLILSRREEEEKNVAFSGFFSAMTSISGEFSTVYYLDITLETTPEEMALIKKQRLDRMPMLQGVIKSGRSSSGEEIQIKRKTIIERSHLGENVLDGEEVEIRVEVLAGESTQWCFASLDHLDHAESQLIENARKLKGMLADGTHFKAEAPRDAYFGAS